MEIQFLETSGPGLRWMMTYFWKNPQLDRKRALQSFEVTKQKIAEFSPPSETYEDLPDVWEIKIQRTAFSILYTIRRDTVYIIDIRDQRGHRSADALRRFDKELRNKYKD